MNLYNIHACLKEFFPRYGNSPFLLADSDKKTRFLKTIPAAILRGREHGGYI